MNPPETNSVGRGASPTPPPGSLEFRIDVDPGRPGFPWWMYERPPAALTHARIDGGNDTPAPAPEVESIQDSEEARLVRLARLRPLPSPAVPGWLGVVALVVAILLGRIGLARAATFLVVIAALLLASAFGRVITKKRPGEPWVGRMLMLGVVVKLMASWFRYYTIVVGYEGVSDASMYDEYGTGLANAWNGIGTAPELVDLTNTNFVRWFTGAVYFVFGIDMITGFIVYGFLAVIGSYLWYRATVDAVPFVNKRLYLGLVLFMPSIAFWPSSIGKEALMQLGIGAVALGTSLLLRGALVRGLLPALAGGWLTWVVRPHLVALVALAAGGAYVLGRVHRRTSGPASLLTKPAGMVIVGFLLVFTVSEGAAFLGVEELSLSSVQAELDEQTERSAQGGSQFETTGNSLNPIHLPWGAVTVLIRPFLWEIDATLQLAAALEGTLLGLALLWRLPSLRAALWKSRSHGFLLFCWILTALYAATFSSFANFGLLVRQRALVLPAVLVLLAVDAAKARKYPSKTRPAGPTGSSPDPADGEPTHAA